MPTLYIMCGVGFSGKSTLSEDYIAQGYSYINQDSQGKADHLLKFINSASAGLDIVFEKNTQQNLSTHMV
jgi:predicted ABC-type ATPase